MRGCREEPKVLKFGGYGVDVKLRRGPGPYTQQDPGEDTVFWSKPRFHEDGQPAGGYNSFVLVHDPERGFWRTEKGQRVSLISVNGIGEIRWRIDAAYMLHNAEGAVEHFGLVPWKEG